MVSEKIITICGPIPNNFVEPIITDNSYIFQNDPNFPSLNLYNFFGNVVTVNSFSECFYYVEEKWDPSKVTIYDILFYLAILLFFSFIIFVIFKKKYYKKYYKKFSIFNFKLKYLNFLNLILKNSKKLIYIFIGSGFIVQSYFVFNKVISKAANLKPFIDEYNALTSNFNFYKSLDFFAGEFSGGNYSVTLTSGPISSVGAVLGWNISNKIVVARVANFYWVYFLQILFVALIYFYFKNNLKFLLFSSSFIILLIPWWQGSLYSLGEIPALLIFVNAIFLFSKVRNFSILLISISIVFGKILNLVPFIGFYLYFLFSERDLKKIVSDIIFFNIPISIWLFFVNSRYVNGNSIVYIKDQLNFVLFHKSSGINNINTSEKDIFSTIFEGEVISWNNYEKFRTLIIPIVFIILIFRNKQNINSKIGNISNALIISISSTYIWFWFFNTTKWIRYTQHFTVLVLIGLFYFLSFKIYNRKLDLILTVALIVLFIDDNKIFIWYFIALTILITYKADIPKSYSIIYFTLSTVLLINFSFPLTKKDYLEDVNQLIPECTYELATLGCVDAYLNSNK